ncbi:hypothetical protein Moror_2153 [Moniliophthora roreri MCA 2997]|uniref:Uncharacterized protein n=1 Tax=Moniliophthora roreri (strain MCA 2997) TaxID=1381753 RepID=V2XWA9_MONRO|nr:hypothetical protein Moror_2153 [Moniliophthora roreri MCA 2997]
MWTRRVLKYKTNLLFNWDLGTTGMANSFPFESIYSIQGVLLAPFVAVGLALFLLGFYILLFGLVVYFLCVRHTGAKRKLHLWWMTTLFVLSLSSALMDMGLEIHTSALGFQTATTQDLDPLLDWVTINLSNIVLNFLPCILYALASCIADMILLYRLFVLWDSVRPIIFIVAMLVLFLTNAVGFVGGGADIITGYFIANAINTFLLTFIIAGRIWWLSREPRRLMGREVDRRYNRIIAMVVESGLLYSASVVVHVSTRQSLSTLGFPLNLSGLVYLMVGIAPTLIILRTSLGLTESAIPDSRMISTLRFGEPPAATEAGQSSDLRTVGFQQGPLGGSDDLEAHKVERSEMSTP